jgi:hypothetical protein
VKRRRDHLIGDIFIRSGESEGKEERRQKAPSSFFLAGEIKKRAGNENGSHRDNSPSVRQNGPTKSSVAKSRTSQTRLFMRFVSFQMNPPQMSRPWCFTLIDHYPRAINRIKFVNTAFDRSLNGLFSVFWIQIDANESSVANRPQSAELFHDPSIGVNVVGTPPRENLFSFVDKITIPATSSATSMKYNCRRLICMNSRRKMAVVLR